MTKPIDEEPYSTPVEKLLEFRNSELINGMSIGDLQDMLVVSRYHITLLENILAEIRKPQSEGGKNRGINKETGENLFDQRRALAAAWMLKEFSKTRSRQFKVLNIAFQQETNLPFNHTNLLEVWRRWKSELNEEEKKELLANCDQMMKIIGSMR